MAESHRVIRVAAGASIDVEYSPERPIGRLQPFISAVSDGIAKWGDITRAVLSAAESFPKLAPAFEIPAVNLGAEFGPSMEYLFPGRVNIVGGTLANEGYQTAYRIEAEDLRVINRLLAVCGVAGCEERQIRRIFDDGLVDMMLRDKYLEEAIVVPQDSNSRSPGIVRLQHACLLYRSSTTGILVDPHFHSFTAPRGLAGTFAVSDVREIVDAILISHSHGDHLSLSTLMLFPREIPIIVPHVPRSNLLSYDIAQTLRDLGFTNVTAPGWYSVPQRIGDCEVHVLPFYGEQPLRDEPPRHRELRNWGNTYYVRTPQFSSWCLVDSGVDTMGSMTSVAEYVAEELDGVDVLLSNLSTFRVGAGRAWPNYITGGGHYWLSLSASQMVRFAELGDQSLTLGPDGVAEVARIAKARVFLPYAHWWSAAGSRPERDSLVEEFAREYDRKPNDRIEILSWNIGDRCVVDRRKWSGQLSSIGHR